MIVMLFNWGGVNQNSKSIYSNNENCHEKEKDISFILFILQE